jgi:hypothetical protein
MTSFFPKVVVLILVALVLVCFPVHVIGEVFDVTISTHEIGHTHHTTESSELGTIEHYHDMSEAVFALYVLVAGVLLYVCFVLKLVLVGQLPLAQFYILPRTKPPKIQAWLSRHFTSPPHCAC